MEIILAARRLRILRQGALAYNFLPTGALSGTVSNMVLAARGVGGVDQDKPLGTLPIA